MGGSLNLVKVVGWKYVDIMWEVLDREVELNLDFGFVIWSVM